MMAYALDSYPDPEEAFEYVRIVFHYGDGTNIPAIFCKDFYAEEIQAEASGESNSTFYTTNFA